MSVPCAVQTQPDNLCLAPSFLDYTTYKCWMPTRLHSASVGVAQPTRGVF